VIVAVSQYVWLFFIRKGCLCDLSIEAFGTIEVVARPRRICLIPSFADTFAGCSAILRSNFFNHQSSFENLCTTIRITSWPSCSPLNRSLGEIGWATEGKRSMLREMSLWTAGDATRAELRDLTSSSC